MSTQSLHCLRLMVTTLQGWIDMPKTTVTIYLEFDDIGHEEDALKESIHQYLTDLIDDDSLVYYINEEMR